MVVIRRPEESGLDFAALLKKLGEALGCELAGEAAQTSEAHICEVKTCEARTSEVQTCETRTSEAQQETTTSDRPERVLSCIGIGTGSSATLTHDAAEAIKSAQIIFGADRLLKSVQEMGILSSGQPLVTEYIGTKILAYLEAHPQYRRIAVLMSGDVGFYSGARGIQEAFAGENVHFYCGISSVVYFASEDSDLLAGCKAAQCARQAGESSEQRAALSEDHHDSKRRGRCHAPLREAA